jgi:plasmid stabilization system protein ParE
MSQYQFTPEAVDDLFEIWSYIAADNLEAANRYRERMTGGEENLRARKLRGRFSEWEGGGVSG